MNKIVRSIPLLLISIFSNPLFAVDSGISVEDAWISEAPPVSKVMVAYMTIKNSGSKPVDIIKAESELYSSIEFHETLHEDGMARMVRYGEITVPAHGSVQFKPGGKHFMLFNPTKHLTAGASVTMKLSSSDNTEITISVPVKKAQH